VLGEPLVHFALFGSLLCGAWLLWRPAPVDQIVLPKDLVAARQAALTRRDGHPPSDSLLQAALRDDVDGEVLFREAVRRRLGEGDIIVRRRLIQKMEYLAEALQPRPVPSDAVLREWLAQHEARYRLPARVALRQVFVSRDRHPLDLQAVAESLRESLGTAGGSTAPVVARTLGDPHPLGMDLALHSQSELAQLFSAELAEAAFRLADGQWSVPLPSAHGLHLVLVTARQPGQLPPLDQLTERLRLDVEESAQVQRRRQALDALRQRYQVVIERADR
jgi:hypothetical protein